MLGTLQTATSTIPFAIVHYNQNGTSHQIIKSSRMSCWGAAGWKYSLKFMPQDLLNWHIKWMKSVSKGHIAMKQYTVRWGIFFKIRMAVIISKDIPLPGHYVYGTYVHGYASISVRKCTIFHFLEIYPNCCITSFNSFIKSRICAIGIPFYGPFGLRANWYTHHTLIWMMV